jgi:hypothetical protein
VREQVDTVVAPATCTKLALLYGFDHIAAHGDHTVNPTHAVLRAYWE